MKCRVCGFELGPNDPVLWFRIYRLVFMPVHRVDCQAEACRTR